MNIPLNIDWQQILLHLFNFVILFGGLYFLLYKPVKKFMAKRAEHYKEIDDKTNNALADAEKLKADYTLKLEEADETIRNRRLESQREAKEAADAKIDEAKAQAEKIISNAKADAQRCKDKIIEQSQEEIKELAVKAAEKLLISSSSEAYDKFLDSAEEAQKNE